MVDDYAGYKALFAAGVTELACLAHVRRKFFELHAANGSPVAAEALQRIAALYAIEQQAASLSAAERRQLRQEHAQPALVALHAWLLSMKQAVAAGSGTAKPLTMHSSAGQHWCATLTRARSPSTIMRSKMRSDRLPSARRTGFSPARSMPADALPPSRLCWVPQNLMASIRCVGWPAYWNVSRRALTARLIRCSHS